MRFPVFRHQFKTGIQIKKNQKSSVGSGLCCLKSVLELLIQSHDDVALQTPWPNTDPGIESLGHGRESVKPIVVHHEKRTEFSGWEFTHNVPTPRPLLRRFRSFVRCDGRFLFPLRESSLCSWKQNILCSPASGVSPRILTRCRTSRAHWLWKSSIVGSTYISDFFKIKTIKLHSLSKMNTNFAT